MDGTDRADATNRIAYMPPPTAAPRTPTIAAGARSWIVGVVLIGVALAGCGVLVLAHLAGIGLPGCGAGSPCARATSGPWGSIPGLGWPVSFLGFAWFNAVLVVWCLGGVLRPGDSHRPRGGSPGREGRSGRAAWSATADLRSVALVIRCGAAVSVVYVVVMVVGRLMCPYCLVVHAANLGLWIVAERAGRGPALGAIATPAAAGERRGGHGTRTRALWAGAGVFIVVTAGLALLNLGARERAAEHAERELSASTSRVAAGAAEPAGFTGRYRLGPERAAVRVVVFTDYQCADCRRIEGELRAAMAADPGISLSVKHFPFCAACNPRATDLHPNACWAARAAEAAGMVGGAAGFGRMHEWLFARSGSFTDAEITAALPSLGLDAGAFLPAMTGPEALERVRADIDEAFALGLSSTPMIFINGVELRGWNAPDGVGRALRAAAAANPDGAGTDRPAGAREKYLADWREGARVMVPVDQPARAMGPGAGRTDRALVEGGGGGGDVERTVGGTISVVLFGDYLEPNTIEADAEIRRVVSGRADVRYEFRHFPVDQSCNPVVPRTAHALACLAARAAEAAAFLKGPDEFWRLHAWLMSRGAGLTGPGVLEGGPLVGLEPHVLAQAMEIEELKAAILEDIGAASALGITAVPMIIIDGRVVPRWKLDGESLLEAMIGEAAGR